MALLKRTILAELRDLNSESGRNREGTGASAVARGWLSVCETRRIAGGPDDDAAESASAATEKPTMATQRHCDEINSDS